MHAHTTDNGSSQSGVFVVRRNMLVLEACFEYGPGREYPQAAEAGIAAYHYAKMCNRNYEGRYQVTRMNDRTFDAMMSTVETCVSTEVGRMLSDGGAVR